MFSTIKKTICLFTFSLVMFSTFIAPSAFAVDLVNSVTVSNPTADPISSNNSASVTDELCYSADLSSSITDSNSSTTPLSTNSYTATITNNGDSTVNDLSFDVTYDSAKVTDISVVSSSLGTISAASFTGSGTSRMYQANISSISLPKNSTLTITFNSTIKSTATGSVNFAFSTQPTGPTSLTPECSMSDPSISNNNSADSDTITPVADFSIVKVSSGGANSTTNTKGSLVQGSNATYTLTITNNGPSAASGPTTVVDTLPSGVTYLSSNGSGWTCNLVGSILTCTNPNTFVNGASSQINVSIKVN